MDTPISGTRPLPVPNQRPRIKTPVYGELVAKLVLCRSENEVQSFCDELPNLVQKIAISTQYPVFHELEKIACKWLLDGRLDHAKLVFAKLDDCVKSSSGQMETRHLVLNRTSDFTDECFDLFSNKKKSESPEELTISIKACKVLAEECRSLGRDEYASIIEQQVIESGCVDLIVLVDELNNCTTLEGLKANLVELFYWVRIVPGEEQDKVFYALEKTACQLLLTKNADFARIIFSQLDQCIRSCGRQNHFVDDFGQICFPNFMEAQSNKGEAEFGKFKLEYREKVQELLLLGRYQYALDIYEQLSKTKCISSNDEEAALCKSLIEKKVSRSAMHSKTFSWAREPGRTASPYLCALLTLKQNGVKNLAHAVEDFEKAKDAGYVPAQEALNYIEMRYPKEERPKRLDQKEASKLAFEIACNAGFEVGFKIDEKKIFSI